MGKLSTLLAFAALSSAASGCVPEVQEADSLVVGPRVLAIRSEPAQIKPREEAAFSALFVSPDGTQEEAPLDWAFCKARKPLAELGPVNPLCLLENADDIELAPPDAGEEEEEPEPILEEIGEGIEAVGDLPSDACRFFGPDRPPPMDGEPAGRPVDADPTGGYYQPLRVFNTDDETVALYEARIICGLPGASQATTVAFNQRFTPNTNPVIEALLADGDRELSSDEPLRVARGETIELEVRWPECDALPACEDEEECEPPPGCEGAEGYVFYDLESRAITDRRESMRVSWFSTGGAYRDARTGRTEQDLENGSPNAWTAPDDDGDVTLWVVLRDDRGGVTWQTYGVRVER